MWLVYAITLHLLFLGSIFIIYFRSPVLSGLTPQLDIPSPAPAKRLILFVTDGLRASSFFEEFGKHIPYLSKLLLQQGMLGISHTHVPTESRPGHIALIAGLYEDPSAVLRGWKENPIDFDSVFNRSHRTWAWGAHDVLSIFSKCSQNIEINFYDHDLDFSGTEKTLKLDQWVFDNFSNFLERHEGSTIRSKSKIIFFLHLLGLDSSGHIHKPSTDLFYENLHFTEQKIFETYNKIEEYFNDNQTVYLLTSDHGMTNSGSHGAGDSSETETPIYMWGAGIKNWFNLPREKRDKRIFRTHGEKIPLFEIEQADIAPLMSSLIGVAVPMNSYGKLPGDILNVSQEYLALSWINNAKQMLAQYEKLLNEFEMGKFSYLLPRFTKLELETIDLYRKNVVQLLKIRNFGKIIDQSQIILNDSLEGIEYYQQYYQSILLILTTIAILGWILQLYVYQNLNFLYKTTNKSNSIFIYAFIMIKILLIFIHLQGIPAAIGIYMILPIICWAIPLKILFSSRNSFELFFHKDINYFKTLLIIFGTELLVFSFIWREIIAIAFLGFSTIKLISLKSIIQIKWIFLSILLAGFPLLKGVQGQKHDLLLLVGILLWLYQHMSGVDEKRHRKNFLKSFLFLLEILNTILCIYFHNNFMGIPKINLIFSWLFLLINFLLPLMSSSNSIKFRLYEIVQSFTMSYMILSISYELFFIILLCWHLELLLDNQIETNCKNQQCSVPDESYNKKFDDYNFSKKSMISFGTDTNQIAFIILLYTIFSFFGTGNIASISSFDINVVRCLVTTFSPFTITILIILKLAIPIIIIFCIISSKSEKKNLKRNFLTILMLCNLMGITALFMVTNKGSWLEIGSSISRFVIMQVTTLVLFLINGLVIVLLKLEFSINKINVMDKLLKTTTTNNRKIV